MENDPWNKMGMSVSVVRILKTNPLQLPKDFKLEPPEPTEAALGLKKTPRRARATKRRGVKRR